MKRPTMLLSRVLLNVGLQANVTVDSDLRTIANRVKHEGMSFLTITLPTLCNTLDRGLADGRITASSFVGFQPHRRRGNLPALLHGFFIRVFDLDGVLRSTPCIDSIRAIRQVTRLFKKVELPCSSARILQAYERYVENDTRTGLESTDNADLRRVAGILWSGLEDFSRELYCSPGKFGAGATAEHLYRNQRYSIKQWPERGDYLFPLSYHGSHREDDRASFEEVDFLTEDRELPVRVVTVPKTLETPRVISVEPSYMMLRQQSVAQPLMDYLEHKFFCKSIRFTDQTVNRELARLGSIDGSLATIDLKDASDLVSNDLVKFIFSVCPTFLDFIQGCRTSRAKLPDGKILNLRKFASMGSAMCFPIEAMTFFTITMMALVRLSGKRPSKRLITALSANCAVYGDDIIVPSETVPFVVDSLQAYGLKVNINKSFHTGLFRESCGGDYYKGHDVTPVYVRHWDDEGNLVDARHIAAYVSLSNQFYLKGLWNVSQYVRDHVEKRKGVLPRSVEDIGGLTWKSVFLNTRLRWDYHRHSWRVRTLALKPATRSDPVLDVRAGMLAHFGPRYLRDWLRASIDAEEYHLGIYSDYGLNPWLSGDDEGSAKLQLVPSRDAPGLYRSVITGVRAYDAVDSRLNRYLQLAGGLDPESISGSLLTSIRPYALNVKRRWIPTRVGISSW